MRKLGAELLLGAVALIFLIAAGNGAFDGLGFSSNWCSAKPIPQVDLDVTVRGNQIRVKTSPRDAWVKVGNTSYPGGWMTLPDGQHIVEASASKSYTSLAGYLGLGSKTCNRIGRDHYRVVIDTTGPVFTSLDMNIVGSNVEIRGTLEEQMSQSQVSVTGFEPVSVTGSEFAIYVPIEDIEFFEVQLSAIDSRGNKTKTQWYQLPLPATRWEKHGFDGNITQVAFSEPQQPSLGWGLNTWYLYIDNQVIETHHTPIWIYGLIAMIPFSVVVALLSKGFAVAEFKKRKQHNEQLAIARAAFARLNGGAYPWARVEPLLSWELANVLRGVDYSEWRLRRSRIRRFSNDVKTVASMWPNNAKVQTWQKMAALLVRNFANYEKSISLAENREFAEAWGIALDLPNSVPAFVVMQNMLAQKWFDVLIDIIDSEASSVTPFLLDALGIVPDRHMLKNLWMLETDGQELLSGDLTKLRNTYALFKTRVKQVGDFGPYWVGLLTYHIDAVTILGLESFANHLLDYGKLRVLKFDMNKE